MICVRQGLRKYKDKGKHKDKYKDKCRNNRQIYDVYFFWKGYNNRSLMMQNIPNMQNMQDISPLFSRRTTKNLRSLYQNQVSTGGPV